MRQRRRGSPSSRPRGSTSGTSTKAASKTPGASSRRRSRSWRTSWVAERRGGVMADLPVEDEVDIAVTGNRRANSGHIYDVCVGSFTGFTRVFTVPEGNDSNDAVRAALDRGVLTVQSSKRLEEAPEVASLRDDDALARWDPEG